MLVACTGPKKISKFSRLAARDREGGGRGKRGWEGLKKTETDYGRVRKRQVQEGRKIEKHR